MSSSVSELKPLAVGLREGAQMVGLGRNTLRTLINAKHIRAVRCGRKLLIPVAELERLVRDGSPSRVELAGGE